MQDRVHPFVAKEARHRRFPKPMCGEPSVKPGAQQANGDPWGEVLCHQLEILNPFSRESGGFIGREFVLGITSATNNLFKAVFYEFIL